MSLGLGLKHHEANLQAGFPTNQGSQECFYWTKRLFSLRNILRSISIAIALVCVFQGGLQAKEIVLDHSSVQVYFSPHGGCTDAIVGEISKAKTEVLVQAYSFTSKPIAKALVDAHKRGVHTEIILDKSQRGKQYRAPDFFAHMGIPTYVDSGYANAHNKVMVVDQETVITGSFNFTRAAEERNASYRGHS